MSKRLSSLEKGLMVLELLNSQSAMRIRELHARLGIPKPTLVRLLAILESYGLVTKLPQMAGYSVTSKVLALSSGFHSLPVLVELARPLLTDLTRKLLWPTSLATLDFDAMVIRYSTIPISPLSHKHSTLNSRLDLGRRAHGRAYLAFTSQAECAILMRLLPDETQAYLRRHMPRYRTQGWAERDQYLDVQTNSIAVPIFGKDEGVLATLGMTYFRKAVDEEEQRRFASELMDAAATLSLGIRQQILNPITR